MGVERSTLHCEIDEIDENSSRKLMKTVAGKTQVSWQEELPLGKILEKDKSPSAQTMLQMQSSGS